MTEATTPNHPPLDLPAEVPISKREVCIRIGISERTLDELIQKKKLFPDGVRLGKQKFWLPIVVERFRASQFKAHAEWQPKADAGGEPTTGARGQEYGFMSAQG